MLVLTRKRNEKILIGESIIVQVIELGSEKVRIGIIAPDDVVVDRAELRDKPNYQKNRQRPKQGPRE